MSQGAMRQWIRNTEHKMMKLSAFNEKTDLQSIMISEQSNARSKDGDRPANHTNPKIPNSWIQEENFFPDIFENNPADKVEKNERCIPLNARMWESPAFLKSSESFLSVYSLEPERSARMNPPASFQPYISLLNWSLHRALKWFRVPAAVKGSCNCSASVQMKNPPPDLPWRTNFSPVSTRIPFP